MSIGKSVKLELQTEFPYEEVSEHPVLGVERVIGYVVKGTPFKVTIRVGSKVKVPLSNAKVEMTLITEETYTPVEIGERPICFVASASQNVITCETRLMVLSTQVCINHLFPFLPSLAAVRSNEANRTVFLSFFSVVEIVCCDQDNCYTSRQQDVGGSELPNQGGLKAGADQKEAQGGQSRS